MDPEQRFLQARQARSNARREESGHDNNNDDDNDNDDFVTRQQHHSQELGIFWSELRRRLQQWEERLNRLHDTFKAANNSQQQQQQQSLILSIRQPFQNLKEELKQLQRHCLRNHDITTTASSTTNANSSSSSSSSTHHDHHDMMILVDWKLPTKEFPNTDLRLLHAEFSKYTQKWETMARLIQPKGKFTFRRYRQELAYRNIHGLLLQDDDQDNNNNNNNNRTTTTEVNDNPPPLPNDESCLQGYDNCIIHIHNDGTTTINHHHHHHQEQDEMPSTPASSMLTSSISLSSPLLLIRNLQHCTVTIDKSIQALHVVSTHSTTIHILQSIASTMHVTACSNSTFYLTSVQQLRIHESQQLHCHVPQLRAGAILEDSTDLVFYKYDASVSGCNDKQQQQQQQQQNNGMDPPVIKKSTWQDENSNDDDDDDDDLCIKDFHWLRSDVPSPNYRIVVVKETNQRLPSPAVVQSPIEIQDSKPMDISKNSSSEKKDGVVAISTNGGEAIQSANTIVSEHIANPTSDDGSDDDSDDDEL